MAVFTSRRALGVSAVLAGGMLLAASVGVALVSYHAADRLVHPPREQRSVVPADRGIAFEHVGFSAQDGVPLVGWWMPAEAPEPLGTVIFLHGYGATKAQSLTVAQFLHAAGYNVLAFDFRAHGQSGGTHTTIGLDERLDVRAALDWVLAREEVDRDRIAIFGWSMGAAAALMASDDLPEVGALIVDSPFARLHNVVSRNLQTFTGLPSFPFTPLIVMWATGITQRNIDDNEPARAAQEFARPLLVIHGQEDPIAHWETDGLQVAAHAGANAQVWLVPDATHVNAVRDAREEYQERVLRFLEESLQTRSVPVTEAAPEGERTAGDEPAQQPEPLTLP